MSLVTCVGWTVICSVILLIVIGVPILVSKDTVKKKDPTFTLDRASVTSFKLTPDGHLLCFFNVVIRANSNLDSMTKLDYSDVSVSIFKDKQKLAEEALADFTQHKGDVTMIKAEPVAPNVFLQKAPLFDFGLESGMGYLDFDVFVTALIDGDNLEVNCRHAIVNITAPFVASSPSSGSSNTSPTFQSVDCTVLIHSLPNNF